MVHVKTEKSLSPMIFTFTCPWEILAIFHQLFRIIPQCRYFQFVIHHTINIENEKIMENHGWWQPKWLCAKTCWLDQFVWKMTCSSAVLCLLCVPKVHTVSFITVSSQVIYIILESINLDKSLIFIVGFIWILFFNLESNKNTCSYSC